jgi:uncharacterized protein
MDGHNPPMRPKASREPAADALDERELAQLQHLLDQVPAPLAPLDVSAVDGFLCGLLLQPHDIEARKWFDCITDVDARPLPAGFDAAPLRALVLRRHDELRRAIAARQWFDPWVFELEGPATPSECVLPWVAGFAAALERFPELMHSDDPQVLEPLALIYMHFDADDLQDAQALQALIDTLEPPADLAEAVQDVVRSVMLLADVTRPRTPTGARRQSRK